MLELCPITLREANEFVTQYHRHHKATTGHKFSIGMHKDGKLVGVCICGRPVSRYLDGIAGGTEWTGCRKPKDSNQYPHEMKQRCIRYATEKKRQIYNSYRGGLKNDFSNGC